MPAADLDALMVRRDEGERYADIFPVTEQILRVEKVKGNAKQRRPRSERDIALVPTHADAEHLLALMHTFRGNADIVHGGGVRPCRGAREREARDLPALG